MKPFLETFTSPLAIINLLERPAGLPWIFREQRRAGASSHRSPCLPACVAADVLFLAPRHAHPAGLRQSPNYGSDCRWHHPYAPRIRVVLSVLSRRATGLHGEQSSRGGRGRCLRSVAMPIMFGPGALALEPPCRRRTGTIPEMCMSPHRSFKRPMTWDHDGRRRLSHQNGTGE
jgi:hypothetical protein